MVVCWVCVGLVDVAVLYASVALVVMGGVALVLSWVFRVRLKRLVAVSGGSVVSVYNRTFAVFDPYGQATTVFHRFLGSLNCFFRFLKY